MNTNASEKTKVSLETLAIYDTKIKQWVINKINEQQKILFFSEYADFPEVGKENTFYTDGKDIYIWSDNIYKKIINSSSEEYDFQWREF